MHGLHDTSHLLTVVFTSRSQFLFRLLNNYVLINPGARGCSLRDWERHQWQDWRLLRGSLFLWSLYWQVSLAACSRGAANRCRILMSAICRGSGKAQGGNDDERRDWGRMHRWVFTTLGGYERKEGRGKSTEPRSFLPNPPPRRERLDRARRRTRRRVGEWERATLLCLILLF